MFSLILTIINLGIIIYWIYYICKLNKEFNEFEKYIEASNKNNRDIQKSIYKYYNDKETEEEIKDIKNKEINK